MIYEKVSTDMNFVDREKKVEKFWDDEKIFQKSMEAARKASPPTPSMTDRLPQTANRISATC